MSEESSTAIQPVSPLATDGREGWVDTDGNIRPFSPRPNRPICGAPLRGKPGQVCQSQVVYRNGRCWLHNGEAPRGLAHPNFKHGRYSEAVPAQLLARYQETINDPDALSHREEIGLFDARIEQLLLKLDTGESADHWTQFVRYLRALDTGIQKKSPDLTTCRSLVKAMRELAEKGKAENEVWDEITKAVRTRSSLAVAEQNRMEAEGKTIPVTEAMVLFIGLMEIVKEVVEDASAIARISERAEELLTRGKDVIYDVEYTEGEDPDSRDGEDSPAESEDHPDWPSEADSSTRCCGTGHPD